MKVLIVGGAPVTTWPHLETNYDLYIGVDRGSLFLTEQGCAVDLAIGDFDSLSELERKRVFEQAKQVVQAPAEKDDTDTQLALSHVLASHPEATITLIGMTGGRIDHFLANLWMVLEPRFKPYSEQIYLKDQQNSIQFLLPGQHVITRESGMKYLAYCCLTPVDELTLRDSKYTLTNQQVTDPISYASNEFLGDTASVSFKSGQIAVIQSKDK